MLKISLFLSFKHILRLLKPTYTTPNKSCSVSTLTPLSLSPLIEHVQVLKFINKTDLLRY